MGWRGGRSTDTRFITSFLLSDFMNRSVITTARDMEETERERGTGGGDSWKGKNCCMLYRKRTIAAIPRLDEGITWQLQGRGYVFLYFPTPSVGPSAHSFRGLSGSKENELKLPETTVCVLACFFRAHSVGSKRSRDISGGTGSLASIFHNLLRNRNWEQAKPWPLAASRWVPTCWRQRPRGRRAAESACVCGGPPEIPFPLLKGPEVWSPSVMGMARDGVFSTCQQVHLYANAKQALVRLITADPIEYVPAKREEGRSYKLGWTCPTCLLIVFLY